MEADLANLNLDDQEDNLVLRQEEEGDGEEDFKFCLVGKEAEFGWDISLRAQPMREVVFVSRWHREELKDLVKSDMDTEEAHGRYQMWDQGVEANNGVKGKGVVRELSRRFHRVNQINEFARQMREDDDAHNMISKSNAELEERPIGTVDGKKRHRVK
ncbi:hypothetical protein GOBAR_AA11567 [Gossypium barbadense]|uniref:Uncharacterized protein n=1 Tax=Gossypium barbadense TaxID=3634 RepID=A0A2P5Y0G6_GOSBA|nr:hypothetical protein GOBAR_AA11567 [Gossypium barbadense]